MASSERPTPNEGTRATGAADFASVTEAKTRAMMQDAGLQEALAELRVQTSGGPLFREIEIEPGAVQPSERVEHVAIEAAPAALPAQPVEPARVEVSPAADPRRAPTEPSIDRRDLPAPPVSSSPPPPIAEPRESATRLAGLWPRQKWIAGGLALIAAVGIILLALRATDGPAAPTASGTTAPGVTSAPPSVARVAPSASATTTEIEAVGTSIAMTAITTASAAPSAAPSATGAAPPASASARPAPKTSIDPLGSAGTPAPAVPSPSAEPSATATPSTTAPKPGPTLWFDGD